MPLETLLSITTAAMTALGAILLGAAQDDLLLPILAAMCAGISLVVTDRMKWIELSRPVANGLALLAVAYSSFEFIGSNVEFQLLAIANLLIYLQVILLFQDKHERIYWQIIVLSVLQVVVAAAISLHVAFGFMLSIYLLLALAELVLFYFYRERRPYLATAAPIAAQREQVPKPQRSSYVTVGARMPSRIAKGFWTTNTRVPFVSPLPASETDEIPVARVFRFVLGFGLTTLAIATVVFFSVPRVGESWNGRHPGGQRLVGFSNEVSLDELGRILDNPTPVMRVSFQDPDTGEPPSLSGEPYFRGTMLDRYHPLTGRWTQRRMTLVRHVSGLRPPPSRAGLLRQEVQIEPSQRMNLFSVFPIFQSSETARDVGVDARTLQLFRTTEKSVAQWEPFQIVGLTNALRFGRMRSLMPCETSGRWGYSHTLENELRFLRSFNDALLPGNIQQLATDILDQAGTDRANPIRVAHQLSAYLEDATRFEYALDQDQPPPTGVDPVEHFLTTTRRGHCEYFASGLVLMLRSQGIPARLVVGFKGGDYNTMGNFYQVRQLHAHAWAEAYIPPEFINDSYLVAGENADAGGWLRLDPTPADVDEGATAFNQQTFAAWGQAQDYLQMLWDNYVVGLNSERQLGSIYTPVAERVAAWWQGTVARYVQPWSQRFDMRAWSEFRRRWLTSRWILSYVTLGLVVVSVGYRWRRQLAHLVQRLCWWWPGLWRWLFGWSTTAGRRAQVGFYRQLEQQLARHGLRRAVGQSHREFAIEAGKLLATLPEGESVARIPQELVDAYYRVRFGRQQLADHDLRQIGSSLKTLAAFPQDPNRA